MLLCIADIFDQRIKFILTIIEIIDFIIKRHPAAAVHMHMGKIRHIPRLDQLFLVSQQFFLLSVFSYRNYIIMVNRSVIFLLRQKHFLPSAVAPENHIYDKPQNRNEHKHQKPRPCAGGIAAFKEHDQTGKDDISHQNDKTDQNQPVDKTIYHIPPPFFHS